MVKVKVQARGQVRAERNRVGRLGREEGMGRAELGSGKVSGRQEVPRPAWKLEESS